MSKDFSAGYDEGHRAGFAEGKEYGYNLGKEKVYIEIGAILDHGGHSLACSCQPCEIIRTIRKNTITDNMTAAISAGPFGSN